MFDVHDVLDDFVFQPTLSTHGYRVNGLRATLAPRRVVACHTSRSRFVSSIIPVVGDDNRHSKGGEVNRRLVR